MHSVTDIAWTAKWNHCHKFHGSIFSLSRSFITLSGNRRSLDWLMLIFIWIYARNESLYYWWKGVDHGKWAGNPNITVATKAFGLRATVQVYVCTSWPSENRVYGLNCIAVVKIFNCFNLIQSIYASK